MTHIEVKIEVDQIIDAMADDPEFSVKLVKGILTQMAMGPMLDDFIDSLEGVKELDACLMYRSVSAINRRLDDEIKQ